MNSGLLGLYLLTLLIILLVGGGLIWAGLTGTASKGGETVLAPCSEEVDLSSLIQIDQTAAPCYQNGVPTSLYYLGTISDGKYDLVVAPYKRPNFDVCVSFCCQYQNGVCLGADYNGLSADQNFTDCMNRLADPNCIPPRPIAVKGTTLYYPYTPTCNICEGCTQANRNPCGKNLL